MTEQLGPQGFRILGASIIGRQGGKFEKHFKLSPRLCAKVFPMIKKRIPDLRPKCLLWCLKLMNACGKTEAMADFCGVHRVTFGPRAWQVMEAIAAELPNVASCWLFPCSSLLLDLSHLLASPQIKLNNRFRNMKQGNVCLMAIDTTDCRVNEQTPFWSGWKSKNFKGAGLKCEIGVAIQSNDICWVHGPFPAGAWHDKTVFRHRLKQLLLPNEAVETDKGHVGEPSCRTPCDHLTLHEKQVKGEARSRMETLNRLFKSWGILKQHFRHTIGKHQTAFKAVAVLTQLALQEGELHLFDVDCDI